MNQVVLNRSSNSPPRTSAIITPQAPIEIPVHQRQVPQIRVNHYQRPSPPSHGSFQEVQLGQQGLKEHDVQSSALNRSDNSNDSGVCGVTETSNLISQGDSVNFLANPQLENVPESRQLRDSNRSSTNAASLDSNHNGGRSVRSKVESWSSEQSANSNLSPSRNRQSAVQRRNHSTTSVSGDQKSVSSSHSSVLVSRSYKYSSSSSSSSAFPQSSVNADIGDVSSNSSRVSAVPAAPLSASAEQSYWNQQSYSASNNLKPLEQPLNGINSSNQRHLGEQGKTNLHQSVSSSGVISGSDRGISNSGQNSRQQQPYRIQPLRPPVVTASTVTVNPAQLLSANQLSEYNNILLTRSLSENISTDHQSADPNSHPFPDVDEAFSMDSEKLKVRFLSAWNNVKNGWAFGKRKASFSSPHPIWLLGVKYDSKGSSAESLDGQDHRDTQGSAELVNIPDNAFTDEPLLLGSSNTHLNPGKRVLSGSTANITSNNVAAALANNVSQNGNLEVKSPLGPSGIGAYAGRRRSSSLGEEVTEQTSVLQNFPAFKHDFQSRIWFTYRKDFPPLPETKGTSDTGWGCMLRSGQMMLGQALVLHLLRRDWRFEGPLSTQKKYLDILRLFDDAAGLEAPFSLHTLVNIGRESGKSVGDWYGPSSVAYVLRDALERVKTRVNSASSPAASNADAASGANGGFSDGLFMKDVTSGIPLSVALEKELSKISIYVAQDCTIYKNDVINQCLSGEEDKAVIILVPVRLGGDYFNTSYSALVQELFHLENCLGIIGGKPRHSLYFVGYQKEKLLYLDPHYCQQTVTTKGEYFPTDTFRCEYPRKMAVQKMDPSCTLGFYCRNRNEFMKFCFQMTPTSLQRGVYPMFVISSSSYEAVMKTIALDKPQKKEKILRVHHLDQDGNATSACEDFVFLEVNKSNPNTVGKHSAASASS